MELVPGTRVRLTPDPFNEEDESIFEGEFQGEVKFRPGGCSVLIHWDDDDITWQTPDTIEVI